MVQLSVLMPAYNAAPYLRQAVDSILEQTWKAFELIVIDDCSSDETPAILASYKDARLRLYHNAQNEGISRSLNRGLDVATGEYIAIMHSDDVALAHRLEMQMAYLNAHPDVDFLGTNMRFLDENGTVSAEQVYPEGNAPSGHYLKWLLLWSSALAHPTMMMRRSALNRHVLRYDPQYDSAEDYELWARAAHVCSLAAIGEVCLLYRRHPVSVSSTRLDSQMALVRDIMQREVSLLVGRKLPINTVNALAPQAVWKHAVADADYLGAIALLKEAMNAFLSQQSVPPEEAERVRLHVRQMLRRIVRRAGAHSRWMKVRAFSFARAVALRLHQSPGAPRDKVGR